MKNEVLLQIVDTHTQLSVLICASPDQVHGYYSVKPIPRVQYYSKVLRQLSILYMLLEKWVMGTAIYQNIVKHTNKYSR